MLNFKPKLHRLVKNNLKIRRMTEIKGSMVDKNPIYPWRNGG